MAVKRSGYKNARQVYWPRCSVCQYMKKSPTFRLRVMQSKYFKPEGHESLATVVHDFGDPFGLGTVYAHMERHQTGDLITARKRYSDVQAPNTPAATVAAVEGEVLSQSHHELALDEFIKAGHEKLQRGEMAISATNFLAAIKIKSDNEKNTKDRRLAMVREFFTKKPDASQT